MAYARDTHYVAAFLRRHLPILKDWTREGTLQWVKWFMCHQRALLVKDGPKLVGVTLVRLVDTNDQAATDYLDTGGRLAYIEVTACQKGIMPNLFNLLRQTFPHADRMAWARSKYNNRTIAVPMAKAALRFT
jgi:hypothetical protein